MIFQCRRDKVACRFAKTRSTLKIIGPQINFTEINDYRLDECALKNTESQIDELTNPKEQIIKQSEEDKTREPFVTPLRPVQNS